MFRTTEDYEISLVSRSGERERGQIEVEVLDETRDGLRHRPCTVRLRWRDHCLEATKSDVYHAFQEVREALESFGLIPDCYGSCQDVQVSGMLADMAGGSMAYRMSERPGLHGPPVVCIFSTEPGLKLETVRVQQAWRNNHVVRPFTL